MRLLVSRDLRFVLACCIAMAALGLRVASQSGGKADARGARFSATAVSFDAPMGGATTPIDITIERWSTGAERDRVLNTIFESGQDKLLDVVQSLPRIGSIRTPGRVGFDLRYAERTPGPDTSERIMILTDRPIAFWEVRGGSRTMDYPFTVIELRILSNGQGEGRMTVGTKITADKAERTIVLENYNIQPVMLKNVRRER